ncbi:glycosyltransferase [Brevundimonas sp. PAMC22021]|uniref:glycosyltransferase n=1 Tax=Brevundimonas sp. PAMC22021 TaxID=2861285 RepID=UPI001C629916|nr:glycosyltransferase [Brevundimonas sp. PAMC22021]QYF86443.1 glycosyltransferase [Brevundimonas sp. PAMC22021]
MKHRNTDDSPRFDADYYRRRYPDLRQLRDADAKAHFNSHGRFEGRRPSAEARFEDSPLGVDLPTLFSAGEYQRLNPDVAAAAADDWEACLHYIRHGKGEKRRFTELDPDFYWRMYLHDQPFNLQAVGRHFRAHEGRPDIHRSLDAMLEAYGVAGRVWLDAFSDRAFSLLNFHWLGEMIEGPRAVARFLDEGVKRLAPFSFSTRFDPDFYHEIHPLLASSPPERAYRHWLFKGLETGEPGDGAEWLRRSGLELSQYPAALVWKAYAAGRLDQTVEQNRWTALSHLIASSAEEPAEWPLLSEGAGVFLLAMAKLRSSRGDPHTALACLERAVALGVDDPEVSHAMGDACHRAGQSSAALSHYRSFHRSGRSTLWSVVLGAECAVKISDSDGALEMLLSNKDAYGGDQPWLAMLDKVVSAKFEDATVRARALYAAEQRPEGDALLEGVVSWTADAWSRGLDLPATLPRRKRKVVILANQSLPQCTHYRVEQKRYVLEAAGYEAEIFDWTDTGEFLAALPDACAAFFYRVPAFPGVVKAILSARSQGVATYYEIDDLIFDPTDYPDPFASFQGQISWDVYQGLIYGTTLYRSAMRLCDFALASTTPLARRMEREVRNRRSFVLRNGLDPRNLGLEAPLSTRAKPPGRIRIVYGSATLAHNQDFHDMAGDALRAVMDRHPEVELCIIGHLDLGDAFSAYGERVIQVELLRDPRAYWALLAECDINLAVLAPGAMADCKSEIKWLEAAILSIPSVLSATETYREVVEHGVTGLLAETPQDWERALEQLVTNASLRAEIGSAARQAALSRYSVEASAQALSEALQPALAAAVEGEAKKRILLVNVFFPPQSIGGATRVVADNLEHLLQSGAFDFAVAATDYDARPEYRARNDSYRGAPIFRIAPPLEDNLDWKPVDKKMADWFRQVLATFQPDLVHFHCVQRLTASIVDVCTEEGVPYFVSVHDGWWLSDYQFLFDEQARMRTPGDELRLGSRAPVTLTQTLHRLGHLRQALDGARRIFAPSRRFAELYREAGFDQAEALSNGLSDLPILARRPSESGRVRLAHIGDTSPHKGFDLVESVLRQGAYDRLELLALSHGRSQHQFTDDVWGKTPVRLAGRVPQGEISDLYAGIDVLLAPSACTESFGLVTREANAAGVWVVTSDRGAIGEDVRPGVDGFVIDVSSPQGLADVLQAINDDPERYLAPAPRNPAVWSSREQAQTLTGVYETFFARSEDEADRPVSRA